MKLVLTVVFTVAVFLVSGWAGLTAIGAVALGVVLLSGVPPRAAARGLTPVAFLLLFTLLAHGLVWDDPSAVVSVGRVGLSLAGLAEGAFFAMRIVLLVLGTSIVTLTTPPVALTDGFSQLLAPLAVIRVPVDDIATMLSIALRFIPTTAEEAERIVMAQTARGAVFDQGGLVARAKAWIPVLVPLFVRLFRRAETLALAMEARSYTGRGRTRLNPLVMRGLDWLVLVLGVTLLSTLAVMF